MSLGSLLTWLIRQRQQLLRLILVREHLPDDLLCEKWNLGYGHRPATCLAMAWQPHIHVFDSKKKLAQIEARLNAS